MFETVIKLNNWVAGAKTGICVEKDENAIRFGILGAASINFAALIDPVRTHPGAVIRAIAARDASRAQEQIERYDLGSSCKAYGSYKDLLADPEIDAVYIALPNGLHGDWTIKALEAGKHVLVENPCAPNAAGVAKIQAAAKASGKIVLEAYHFLFHPALQHVRQLVQSGRFGDVQSIYATLKSPAGFIKSQDIRRKYELAGGACMDMSYVFVALSFFGSRDMTGANFSIDEACARKDSGDERIDEAMRAKVSISEGHKAAVTGTIDVDLAARTVARLPALNINPKVVIELEKARIELTNFVLPFLTHTITVEAKNAASEPSSAKYTERVYEGGGEWNGRGQKWWSTYRYQLEAFVDAVRARDAATDYTGPWIDLEMSKKWMQMIDEVYEKAGLPIRGVQ